MMPRSGDRYVMPDGLGEYLVVRSHEETEGEYVEMEWWLPASAFAPPPHRHPMQVESYEVLEGSFEVMIDGVWRRLATGAPPLCRWTRTIRFDSWESPCACGTFTVPEAGSTSSSSGSTGSSPPHAFADSSTRRLRSQWRSPGTSTATCSCPRTPGCARPSPCSHRSVGCAGTEHTGRGDIASRPKQYFCAAISPTIVERPSPTGPSHHEPTFEPLVWISGAHSCSTTGPSSRRRPRRRSQSGSSTRPRQGRGRRWRSRAARPGARSAERSRSTRRPCPARRASRRGRS